MNNQFGLDSTLKPQAILVEPVPLPIASFKKHTSNFTSVSNQGISQRGVRSKFMYPIDINKVDLEVIHNKGIQDIINTDESARNPRCSDRQGIKSVKRMDASSREGGNQPSPNS
jgi:hypothetical protein